MASDILIRRRRELNSDDVQYDQNIFDEALLELNKVVQLSAQDEPRLNIDQKKVFTALLSTIDNNEGKLFCLDAQEVQEKHF
ncbi:unnamed protein product [Ceratitis capitata]|uniref:(Mediterranean fruit fly) hypothetical protein n=1 Tax=Ceratitis capitata TaxID=7213 RepID=A0A811URW9_CERCA|nr:unnamed protein product [Ceratitis capitata]